MSLRFLPLFDASRRYRYRLDTTWNHAAPAAAWIMLNPGSVWDEAAFATNQTVQRIVAFSKAWGYGGIRVANLFAWCSSKPKALRKVAYPVGPGNDEHILDQVRGAGIVVAAWGVSGRIGGRDRHVIRMLEHHRVPLHALRLTRGGHPAHPLFSPFATRPITFPPDAA